MWEELGIAQTRDAKAIRKAYADRLRAVNKSGDRQAFQRLRNAYERAMAYAGARPAVAAMATAPPVEAVQVRMPDPPQPDPPLQRSESDLLLDNIRAALAARDVGAALNEYERGLAQGLLPLGRHDAVLEQIMRLPVSDPEIAPVAYEALMRRVGWTADQIGWGGTQRGSQVRVAAIARRDAERWFQEQADLARGAQSVWQLLRRTYPYDWPGALARRRVWRRNARLLLEGGWRLPWIGKAAVKDLENRIALYQMHKGWLKNRIAEGNVERAQAHVVFVEEWGRPLKYVVVALFAVPLLIALALTGSGAVAAVLIGSWLVRRYLRKA
jgi:hypothetical protein